MSLLSLYQIQSGTLKVSPEELAQLKHASLAWSLGGIIPLADIAAAITLFMLRKVAFFIFLGLCLLGGLNLLWQLLTTDLLTQIETQGLVGAILGYGVAIIICFYTYQLKQKKVLT